MPVFQSNAVLFLVLLAAIATRSGAQAQATQGQTQTSNVDSQDYAGLRTEVEQLKRLVLQQQDRINALESGYKAVSSESPSPSFSSNQATSQDTHILSSNLRARTASQDDQNTGSSDERIRNLERKIKGIGPINVSGDIRLRGEPFFGGPSDEDLQRARARVRARLNAIADLSDQFRAGISLASGDINDPTTTNQTLTGFYTRKPVGIDQAFVEYRPSWFKSADFIGGKFRYPWYNTELTWDKDINPEGAAQTFAFNLNTPVLKRLAIVGFELPLAEAAGTQPADRRILQNITYGGQIQTTWQIIPSVKLSAYAGFYDYRGSDSIAFALAKANSKNPQTPFVGLLPLGTGNAVQNSIYTTTQTTVITVGATKFPTGVINITNAQFASRFGLFDNIARLDIDTGNARHPLSFIGDYVQNTEACANVAHLSPAPANSATATFARTNNFTCNPHARHAYWLEGRLGRLQKKHDWQAGYTRIYVEREAVLSNFNYSDIRQGSNVTQHRFDFFYQLHKSVQLGFTALAGRPLASAEDYLTRLQFDTIYVF